MTSAQREKIQELLESGCKNIEKALKLSREYGWGNSDGFCAGESHGVLVCVLEDGTVPDHKRALGDMIKADLRGFGAGAW